MYEGNNFHYHTSTGEGDNSPWHNDILQLTLKNPYHYIPHYTPISYYMYSHIFYYHSIF